MFHGKWRHVPRFVQRGWERVVPKLFGGCATSTINADGRWTGGIFASRPQKHEPDCVLTSSDHQGPCVDEPPHLYDPRPDPREHPEFWTE